MAEKAASRLMSVILTVIFLLSLSSMTDNAKAAAESYPPDAGNITITNRAAGYSDTIYVSALSPKDIVKVYNASSGGRLLGYGSVTSAGDDVTIKISQLGSAAGSVFISVTSYGCAESSRVEAKYDAEPASTAPGDGSITVTNNATGTYDTVYLTGLSSGDTVKVFNAAEGGKLLGRGTVSSSGSEITIKISQLGTAAGSVFVSVTSTGCLESVRVEAKYDAEPVSAIPDVSNITIENNAAGTYDTVYVCGLSPNDVVKVYNALSGGRLLAKGTVTTSNTEVTIKISQIGSAAGSVYISVTSSGCLESGRIEAKYDSEPGSNAPDSNCINVTNNAAGTADTVYVSGLCPKDLVRVYNAASGGKLLGSATVSSSGSEATVRISQIGSAAGSVFVSVKSAGCIESGRTEAAYTAETTTDTPDTDLITVTNNAKGTPDTVTVSGLNEGDIIKVYSAETGGRLLGSATVSKSQSSVTVKITQLGSLAGTVYITHKTASSLESSRTPVSYSAEQSSNTPLTSDIIIVNNPKGTADTVHVQNLNVGDIVKVYSAATGGTLLGKATASDSEATISIAQLGTGAGSVFVSITSSSMNESTRTEISYSAESATTAPPAGNILVTNNPAGTADSVNVSGLNTNDIVKVYNSSGTLLGKATASGTTAAITITQLGSDSGSVFVSVTSTGKAESARTEATYSAEAVSAAPDEGSVTITNNASGMPDTVYVTGLKENDLVTVYQTAKKGTALGTATAAVGTTYATVSINQLGTSAGSVFITVTSSKSLESSCTEVSYDAEEVSSAPSADEVIITNNVTGTADTVYLAGLSDGDIVKVYDKLVQGIILGTATATASASSDSSSAASASAPDSVTIKINQLGIDAGKAFVTITSKGKTESPRTEVSYSAEPDSTAPNSDDITVSNNSGSPDTIFVTGLSDGDIVKVYKTASKAESIGTATVASGASNATVSIPQLGTGSGSLYVSVTSPGSLESALTQVSYSAETQTSTLAANSVSVTNNYNTPDTVVVTSLATGDIINVYDTLTGGNLLGTATVTAPSTTATVTINQLKATAGSIFITKTSRNLKESDRVEVGYNAEPVSAAPLEGNITIQNNSGASDTITVIGLKQGDLVTVYKTLTGSNVWGSATVASSSSSVTITVPQLGTAGGSVYVSVTSADASESARAAATYSAEAQSDAPKASNVTVVNNYNIKSTVTVTGLANNDIVNVYGDSNGGTLLGTGTVSAYGNSVQISLSGLNASGGTIYLTVTSTNKSESEKTPVTYSSQNVSSSPAVSDITIVNNASLKDTITVKNVSAGTIINVYDAATAGNLLGTATASGISVVVSIDQLGTGEGSVYLTATTSGKTESARTQAGYTAESASDPVSSGNINIVNNSGASDTISITGLTSGDVVKVYKDSSTTSYIATATAAGELTTVISIPQLGTSSGSVFITVTTSGKTESSRTEAVYKAESKAPSTSNISIQNNAGISDTVTVTGLSIGDTVNVYGDSTGNTLIGTASVSSGSSVTISISQISSAAGYIYVGVINSGCAESSLTKASYLAEQTTDAPDDGEIYVINYASGTPDTVTVYNLTSGDVIKVYDSGLNLLGKATAASGSTNAVVTISDLGSTEGSIYVTKKSKGKNESDKTEINYPAESQSSAPYAGDITVINNVSISDTITVLNMKSGSLVKVYSSDSCLGYATVASGSTSVTISIAQLGTSSGTLYVSSTEIGKTESEVTAVDYAAESQSNSVSLSYITVVNNPEGTPDTITVTGRSSGDVIQIFDQASGGSLIASASADSETLTISVPQLGISAGSIYITCTSTGKSESDRIRVNYSAE